METPPKSPTERSGNTTTVPCTHTTECLFEEPVYWYDVCHYHCHVCRSLRRWVPKENPAIPSAQCYCSYYTTDVALKVCKFPPTKDWTCVSRVWTLSVTVTHVPLTALHLTHRPCPSGCGRVWSVQASGAAAGPPQLAGGEARAPDDRERGLCRGRRGLY